MFGAGGKATGGDAAAVVAVEVSGHAVVEGLAVDGHVAAGVAVRGREVGEGGGGDVEEGTESCGGSAAAVAVARHRSFCLGSCECARRLFLWWFVRWVDDALPERS